MFISEQEASKRLTDPKNRLRGADVRPTSKDRFVPPDREVPDIIDKADIVEDTGPIFDLSELESQLQPRIRGSRYRGKIDAQTGIAETAIMLGDRAAGGIFQLSHDQTGAYSEGQSRNDDVYPRSKNHPPKPELKRRIDAFKEQISLKAVGRLGKTLDLLSDDKLSEVSKATELSTIGKDMAVILERVSPKDPIEGSGVHFHLYRPEINTLNKYETIEVGGVLSSSPSESER